MIYDIGLILVGLMLGFVLMGALVVIEREKRIASWREVTVKLTEAAGYEQQAKHSWQQANASWQAAIAFQHDLEAWKAGYQHRSPDLMQ